MSTGLLILGLVLFVALVILHELGHFIAARRNGVKVEEFGIGFPPAVWSRQMKGGFKLSINLLPLGGFVRLMGENESDKTKGGFGAAKLWAKIKIMLAGVAANLVIAIGLFTLLALVGMPQIIENQFSVKSNTKVVQELKNKDHVIAAEVLDSSPAKAAGIISGDRIVSVNKQPVTSVEMLSNLTRQAAGQTVQIVVERNGQQMNLQATLNSENKEDKGYLGLASASGASGVELTRSTWSAPIVALGLTKQLSAMTYKGLFGAISGLIKGDTAQASQQVAGPVGVFGVLKEGSTLGLNFVLLIVAIISLTLALINALPIPALDGGRLFITLLFRALNRPLTKRTEEWIHGSGFVLLLVLMLLVTISDIGRM